MFSFWSVGISLDVSSGEIGGGNIREKSRGEAAPFAHFHGVISSFLSNTQNKSVRKREEVRREKVVKVLPFPFSFLLRTNFRFCFWCCFYFPFPFWIVSLPYHREKKEPACPRPPSCVILANENIISSFLDWVWELETSDSDSWAKVREKHKFYANVMTKFTRKHIKLFLYCTKFTLSSTFHSLPDTLHSPPSSVAGVTHISLSQ